jgi:hypothetical protein
MRFHNPELDGIVHRVNPAYLPVALDARDERVFDAVREVRNAMEVDVPK